MRAPGAALLALSRVLLGAAMTRVVIEPAVADLQLDWSGAVARNDPRGARRARLAGTWHVVHTLTVQLVADTGERLAAASWWALLPALLAVLAGAHGILLAPDGAALASRHAVFAAAGCALAVALIALPRGLARALSWPGAAVTLALLGAACGGPGLTGAHRWVSVGPLRVEAAALCAPVFMGVAASLARRPAWSVAFTVVCMVLLDMQRHLGAVAVYALGALVVVHRAPQRWVTRLVSLIALGVAVVREPALPSVAHVEGVPGLLAEREGLWLVLGVGALLAMGLSAGRLASRLAPGGERSLGVALALFLVSDPLLALVTNRGVGLLAFGGSSILAVFVALGLLTGAEARGRLARVRASVGAVGRAEGR